MAFKKKKKKDTHAAEIWHATPADVKQNIDWYTCKGRKKNGTINTLYKTDRQTGIHPESNTLY